MKVYLVYRGYNFDEVKKIFDSREKAENFVNTYFRFDDWKFGREELFIREYEVE